MVGSTDASLISIPSMRFIALGVVGVAVSCVQAATWTKVAPTNRALPRIDPPPAFNRSENVVFPVGGEVLGAVDTMKST